MESVDSDVLMLIIRRISLLWP